MDPITDRTVIATLMRDTTDLEEAMFETDSRGLMSRSHLDAPEESPKERFESAVQHFLPSASNDIKYWIERGHVADLETTYSRLDGDDASTLWQAMKAGEAGLAIAILARARAEELAEEAME